MPEEKRDLRVTLGVKGEYVLDALEILVGGLVRSVRLELHGGDPFLQLRGCGEIPTRLKVTTHADRWDIFLIIPVRNPQDTAISISRMLGHRDVSNAILVDLDDSDLFNYELSYIVESSDFERWAIKVVPFVEELAAGVDPWVQINLLHDDTRDALLDMLHDQAIKPVEWHDTEGLVFTGLPFNIVAIENNEDVPTTTLSLEVEEELIARALEIVDSIALLISSVGTSLVLGPPGFEMYIVRSSGMISIAVHLPAEQMFRS